ncbi:MAG: hypothetical protein B7Z16_15000 [Algoriphagus sp. 32-45-6]|nr:MAG: hypothetical protein B7Z16_15000 [Algoriphagus sp. 32-45-6]
MQTLIKTRSPGFTIVELLIVVVVIAILAAITIVSFNGISARATNTKIVSAAKSYATLLEMYRQELGEYPEVEAEYVCLPGTYPAGDGFAADSCERNGFGGGTPSTYTTSSNYNIRSILQAYQQNLPDASYGKVLSGMAGALANQQVRGVLYSNDGAPQIIYHQANATTCPFGESNIMAAGSRGVTCIYYLPSGNE